MVPPLGGQTQCRQCGTELAVAALACPGCLTLVHTDQLNEFAKQASDLTAREQLIEARDTWQAAIQLLPPGSRQHAVIRRRMDELTSRIHGAPPVDTASPSSTDPWWKRGAAALIASSLLIAGKLKFLLLGLTKASTVLSMFAFFG